MLWCAHHHLKRKLPRSAHLLQVQRSRNFWSWPAALQTATDGFLDVALAIPYPSYFPPYASTIILTTVVSRIVITLPFSIWAKRRQWRLEEEAIPELLEFRKAAAKTVAQQMKNERFRGSLDVFKKEHSARLSKVITENQKAIFAAHNCSPTPTLLIPLVSQMPLFVLSTIFFSHLSSPSLLSSPLMTGIADESFLTLTSLARPDATAVLPIALGLVTLANVETAHWFVGVGRAAREAAREKRRADEKKVALEAAKNGVDDGGDAKKALLPNMREVVQGSLRLFSIARIIIGVMVDGTVIIYWLSSATFGLVQSWAFNWWDARRETKMVAAPSPALIPKVRPQITPSRKSQQSRTGA